ncbi:MAG TPA: LytTR family DNA-binding domain-containing protein [Bacillota bacterium]|nr:LytTR family DNA-binding domain-containing protein [Bacillota bacterium]
MESLTVDSLLNVIGELFSDEISIVVANTKEYIYYRPSKRIDLKIKPGDVVKKNSIAYRALEAKQKVSEFNNRDVFGVPYQGMAVPIYDRGELLGCIVAVYPTYTDGKSVVTVRTPDGWRPIPFQDVKYLEVKNRKTHVYANGFSGTHNYSLQEFEYFLPRNLFVRCHRSYIVNVHHIKDIFPDTHSTFVLELGNGVRIPVSQSYASYFRKLLGF